MLFSLLTSQYCYINSSQNSQFSFFPAEMLRSDFSIAACFELDVKKYFKIDSDRIVLFYPEIYWSKYEPKHIIYENVWIFNYRSSMAK